MEEKLLTLECVLAELGYKTVRNTVIKSVQIVIGEVRIICDEVELVYLSETYKEWGYTANILYQGKFIATVNRWT